MATKPLELRSFQDGTFALEILSKAEVIHSIKENMRWCRIRFFGSHLNNLKLLWGLHYKKFTGDYEILH